MWNKVKDYIRKHNLLEQSELYVVALSGGADSVALLLALRDMGFQVHAAHCNFHLRGEESDRDEIFCVSLCQRLGVVLHRVHFDTHTYAEFHKVSIEMAARTLRYGWFSQLCRDIGAAAVCVAHHRDDSVETVLLNLVRGTGLRGMTGIRPDTTVGVRILRPLLGVTRAEIEAFLAERGQEYVTDSTNLEADVLRNKVRLEVLPLLETLNPAVRENIWRTAEHLAEAQAVLDSLVGQYSDCKELELSEFIKYGSSEYITFEWAKNYGFNGSQVSQILAAGTGAVVSSALGYDLLKDRGRLVVEKSMKPMKPMRIPEEGTYVLSENSTLSVRKCTVYISKTPHIATLDAAKVRFPLTVRRVEEGDWMQPYGMKGRKLLSDLMTDVKMTMFQKRRQLVVVDAEGVIVWLVGRRVTGSAAVSTATEEVLELMVNFKH